MYAVQLGPKGFGKRNAILESNLALRRTVNAYQYLLYHALTPAIWLSDGNPMVALSSPHAYLLLLMTLRPQSRSTSRF
jgi:hypothetical protein